MTIEEAYNIWLKKRDKESLGLVIKQLSQLIDTEVYRYPGPKSLLRHKARLLAARAIKTYDPSSKTKLSSWVVTQLQPLNRYGRSLAAPVHVPELASRQAAELEAVRQKLSEELGAEPTDEQLADTTGLSVTRIRKIKNMMPAYVHESVAAQTTETGEAIPQAVTNVDKDPALNTAAEAVYMSLNDRDKMIFDLKVGKNGREALDNKAIAKRLGVSEGLVSQRSLEISKMIQDTYGKI